MTPRPSRRQCLQPHMVRLSCRPPPHCAVIEVRHAAASRFHLCFQLAAAAMFHWPCLRAGLPPPSHLDGCTWSHSRLHLLGPPLPEAATGKPPPLPARVQSPCGFTLSRILLSYHPSSSRSLNSPYDNPLCFTDPRPWPRPPLAVTP